jgi:hypothetical protein
MLLAQDEKPPEVQQSSLAVTGGKLCYCPSRYVGTVSRVFFLFVHRLVICVESHQSNGIHQVLGLLIQLKG